MANRRFTSQFSFSMERMPVRLMGSFKQSGSTGSKATVTAQGLTYTAVRMGTAGNSITVTLTAGGTAGSEVVTVANKAISVQIQSGVSTQAQVVTAIQGSTAASALITVSAASGATAVNSAAAVSLATGTDTAFTQVGGQGVMSLVQIDTGVFEIDLADSYAALLAPSIMIQKASATDIMPQMVSADPTTAQTVVFRTIATATPTNLANGDMIYIDLVLRNSAATP